MGLLSGIWVAALFTTASSMLWMAGLVLARALRQRLEARRAADRKAVTAALLGVLDGAPGANEGLAPFLARPGLLAGCLLDFMALVRGRDRERLIGTLRDKGVEALLQTAALKGRQSRRLAAIEVLCAFPSPQTEQTLTASLADPDPDVRIAAARSLLEAGAPVSAAQLLALPEAEEAPSRLWAELLRTFAVDHAWETAEALGPAALSSAGRAMVVEAIGFSGDYRVLPRLLAEAADQRAEVRAAAVRALGRLSHPAARSTLAAALDDSDWEVRGEAAEAVGRSGFADQTEALAGRLADPVWWVRFRAAQALVALGEPGLRRLTDAADSDGGDAGRAASLALAERAPA